MQMQLVAQESSMPAYLEAETQPTSGEAPAEKSSKVEMAVV
jgi:hypothetical protein